MSHRQQSKRAAFAYRMRRRRWLLSVMRIAEPQYLDVTAITDPVRRGVLHQWVWIG